MAKPSVRQFDPEAVPAHRRAFTTAAVRALDSHLIEARGVPGIVLMKRAGRAAFEVLRSEYAGPRRLLVLCGHGNNAGDGYVVAGLAADAGWPVTLAKVGERTLSGDAATARAFALERVSERPWAPALLEGADVIVDALLGTGLTGALRDPYASAVRSLRGCGLPVLALDVPTGLDADTGLVEGHAVRAEHTVTFIALKRGLLTRDGPDHVGVLHVAPLVGDEDGAGGAPADGADGAEADPAAAAFPESPPGTIDVLPGRRTRPLGRRPRTGHKGTFGHTLVIGGDNGMGGAVALAGEAALRAGSGLVSVFTRPDHVGPLMARRPELMVRHDGAELPGMIGRAAALVVGPGLGRGAWGRSTLAQVASACGQGEGPPLVLDADALNLLAESPFPWPQSGFDRAVVTPHPGEAARLLDAPVGDRFAAATALRERLGGAVVVLKGAGTLVADGDGLALCPYGNPGLGTGGTGDVLAGLIGGLLAQGADPGHAARLGVCVHALAGDRCARAAGERGLVAGDLFEPIRTLLNP